MGFFEQSNRINVVYRNGVRDRISPALLTTLLDSQQIEWFERSAGWVKVGADKIRSSQPVDYRGEDRRTN